MMTRSKTLEWAVLGICSLGCLFFSPITQAQEMNGDGHLLKQLDLVTESNLDFIRIRGSYLPRLFSKIEVSSNKEMTLVQVVIPQGLSNPQTLPSPIRFPSRTLIDHVEIEESIQSKQKPISFSFTLRVIARQPILLALDLTRSNEQQLMFSVVEKNRTGEVQEPLPPPKKNIDPSHAQIDQTLLLHPVSALLVYQRPTVLQLSVLNASPNPQNAEKLAVLLDQSQRYYLENRIGMKLEITNISSVRESVTLPQTKIYFRPNYLAAALALAQSIPGDQMIEPMPLEHRGKIGIDIEIYVGSNFE